MRRFVPLLLAACSLFAAACTSVAPEDLPGALPVDDGDESSSSPSTSSTTTTTTLPPVFDFNGAIAIGGLPGLVITDDEGELLAIEPDEPQGPAAQPTWSRDGDRAVALLPTVAGPEVVVTSVGETFTHPARRPYFFFSWSGDGRYIAALGPGPTGTTLDILTDEGELATEASLDTQSFYLAWEPGGDDLVVHRDRTLELVRDPLDLATLEPLGEPGQSFLAPAWIPGTREIIIVDEVDDGRLIRLDVDTGERIDLGPVGDEAGLVVSPDGSRLFLSHSGPNVEFSDDITVSFPVPAQDQAPEPEADPEDPEADPGDETPEPLEATAASEIVLLDSGMRVPINDERSLWGEWSRDGSALVFLQPAEVAGVWRVLDENGVRDLGAVLPSRTFFRNYIFFAWQYVESPRLWSPDGDAFVFAASEDDRPGIFVQPIDGERRRISDGDIAFWAPELPAGGQSPA